MNEILIILGLILLNGILSMTEMERVPSTGEHFTWKGFKFQIVDKDNARIDKLMVSRD